MLIVHLSGLIDLLHSCCLVVAVGFGDTSMDLTENLAVPGEELHTFPNKNLGSSCRHVGEELEASGEQAVWTT